MEQKKLQRHIRHVRREFTQSMSGNRLIMTITIIMFIWNISNSSEQFVVKAANVTFQYVITHATSKESDRSHLLFSSHVSLHRNRTIVVCDNDTIRYFIFLCANLFVYDKEYIWKFIWTNILSLSPNYESSSQCFINNTDDFKYVNIRNNNSRHH